MSQSFVYLLSFAAAAEGDVDNAGCVLEKQRSSLSPHPASVAEADTADRGEVCAGDHSTCLLRLLNAFCLSKQSFALLQPAAFNSISSYNSSAASGSNVDPDPVPCGSSAVGDEHGLSDISH